MRKLIYSMQVTLDGYIAALDGDLSWGLADEELHRFIGEQIRTAGATICGKGVYQEMVSYWPTAAEDPNLPDYMLEFAQVWNNSKKYVISRTLENAHPHFTLIRENAVEEVRKLKEQPGGDIFLSGSQIAATLINNGLVDEYQLFVHPAIIGSGKPFFPRLEDRIRLQLVETHVFQSGVVVLHYRDLKTGKEA